MDWHTFAALAAFGVLCGIALRRGLRYRHPASLWLALSFASLAAAAIASTAFDEVLSPSKALVALMLTGGGLLIHPLALLQFANTLQPVRRWIRGGMLVLAILLLAVVAAVAATDPDAFTAAEPSPAAAVLLTALALVWLTVALFVARRLIRFGRGLTSSVGRARAWTMAGGVVTLAGAIAFPFLVPDVDEISGAWFALASSAIIYVGYVPPRWLRSTLAGRDMRRLRQAELTSLRTPDGDMLAWLTTVMEVWDAFSAWLEVDGRLVARAGPGQIGSAQASAPGGVDEGVHVERVDDRVWRLVAEAAGGRLTVLTTLDPVLFGDDESDLLLATAARMRGADDRRNLGAREREAALDREAAAHRAETVRLRDDVLSTLSHELRTPLVMLRGVPELLLSRWDELSGADAKQLVSRVHGNALTLHRLVESTLLLAQARAGELTPHPRDSSVAGIIEEAIDQAAQTGTDVSRLVVEDLQDVEIRTDPALASRILTELVHNALTYSEPPAPVRVSAHSEQDRLSIRIADQGRGIDHADRAALLQAFHRAGDVLTRDRRGLGVGLTLARHLANLLGAVLEARPGDGVGTVVSLDLPRALPPAAPVDDLRRPATA